MFESGIRQFEKRCDVIRKGVKFAELYSSDTPVVSMRADAEIKMTLDGTFFQNESVDLLTDHLKPYVGIDGVWYPLGEYITTSARAISQNGITQTEIEAYDLSYLVKRKSLEEKISLKTGQRYTDVIQSFLIESGLERIICDDCTETLKTDREDWEIGDSYLSVVNQLLSEINFLSLWIDLDGNARLSRYQAPTANNIQHSYMAGKNSLVADDYTSETDIYNKYNVFRAVVSNPDYDAPLTATAEIDDPNIPFSTVRLGRLCAPVEKLDNIASLEELQAYVDNVKSKSMISTENITFTTAINPTHGVGDVVALQNRYFNGIYEEIEWEIPLAFDEEMTHKAKRVLYL